MSRRRRLGHPTRVALGALAAGAPAVLFALGFVWLNETSVQVRWTVTAVVLGAWLAGMRYVQGAVQRPMQTLANLVAALREGDYSARGRSTPPGDALGELTRELNAFSDLLRDKRLGDVETAALLARVMAEIDVAIITCDERGRVRLSNRAAEAITGRSAARALGEPLGAFGLGLLLEGEAPRKVALPRPVPAGDWELRRSTFRQEGRPHTLIVLADLRRALREEERAAWQRLVRVLGHELNNSLAPIRSLAEHLGALLARAPRPPDVDEDLARGLGVIQRRAEALNRFMGAFTALARLPPPRRERLEVAAWVRRIAALETRLSVEVTGGPPARLEGDPDQLDQVLLNLLRNAVDAAQETGGGVKVGWRVEAQALELRVDDEGRGILDPSNLFVPFFTTKPKGSGIGLALSRQILENHGGAVRLENHPDAPGCAAIVTLPLPVDTRTRPGHPLP